MGYGLGNVMYKAHELAPLSKGVSDQGVTMSLFIKPLNVHVKGFGGQYL